MSTPTTKEETCESRQLPQVKDKDKEKPMSAIIIPETEAMYTPELVETAYLPDDLNWRVLTPSLAARAIAKANGHLTPALVVVRSWTQKGRGGQQGWTTCHHTFVVVDGKVNPLKMRIVGGETVSHNGGCQMCGSVFVDYVLKWALAPDGWLKACPRCIEAGGMHTEETTTPHLAIVRPYTYSKQVRPAAYAYRISIDLTQAGAVQISKGGAA